MSRIILKVPVKVNASVKMLERNRPKCAAVSPAPLTVIPLANGKLTCGQAR